MEDEIKVSKFISDFNELAEVFNIRKDSYQDEFLIGFDKFLHNKNGFDNDKFRAEVRDINHVRNVIVHDYKDLKSPVIPSDLLCKKLEFILQQFKNPPKWDSIAIRDIYSCSEDDQISDVIKEMAENTFTHVPVVKDGIFQWLLSESLYIQWIKDIYAKENCLLSTESKVSELKKYLNNINDDYKFLPRDTDIYTITEKFEKAIKEKKRLGVIFITQSGKETEKILGLITAWDLGKVDNI